MDSNERRADLVVGGKTYGYYPIAGIEGAERLPFPLKVLLENVLRQAKTDEEARELSSRIVQAGLSGATGEEIQFMPARVLFQDFTGVPVFVDFAAMREASEMLGGDPSKINPQIPCDLVIDHSVIADEAGCAGCLEANEQIEYARNRERYEFLKWAQLSFENVRIVPPGKGICHQLNIEAFAHVAMTADEAEGGEEACPIVYFDTVVGTDSHTPTVNGCGVLGWGVGGIEAEAASLGQPITTLVPRVIGVRLTNALREGATAMDVALTFAQRLREKGVVGAFVECFGDGVESLTATQRACISNMTPEYGCTCTLFPIDEQTLSYLRLTGRSEEQVALVRAYAEAQGAFGQEGADERVYADVIEIDLAAVEPSLAGPSRPHDRIALANAKSRFHEICGERHLDLTKRVGVDILGQRFELGHGALAIAAVTSCTTATDPAMMLSAALLARNAAARGLSPKPWVKTILAPGSHVMALLLERTGLQKSLEDVGFFTCGFGCMSCIGNSGPLLETMHAVSEELELASVLSGNRNFEGRISPDVSQNYLMQPALVVAYALAGTMDIDLVSEPLGLDGEGSPVYLSDIQADQAELQQLLRDYVTPELYRTALGDLFEGDETWQGLEVAQGKTFAFDEKSTYVRRAPYFDDMEISLKPACAIEDARVLALLGDFITTDHISPAGSIALDSPAARYLEERGVAPEEFNTYGARRGNHEVMMRGTFANVKLQNKLVPDRRGGYTRDLLSGEVTTIFDAAMQAEERGVAEIVVAGKMYGSGSSRDWAAKGPMLLGVRAVIAESFERIHRSNLIGMGILPLQFLEGQNAETLGLDGTEAYHIPVVDFTTGDQPATTVKVTACRDDGSTLEFDALVRIDTATEGTYYANGGILPFVLRSMMGA